MSKFCLLFGNKSFYNIPTHNRWPFSQQPSTQQTQQTHDTFKYLCWFVSRWWRQQVWIKLFDKIVCILCTACLFCKKWLLSRPKPLNHKVVQCVGFDIDTFITLFVRFCVYLDFCSNWLIAVVSMFPIFTYGFGASGSPSHTALYNI